jgi:hypothetical protein
MGEAAQRKAEIAALKVAVCHERGLGHSFIPTKYLLRVREDRSLIPLSR